MKTVTIETEHGPVTGRLIEGSKRPGVVLAHGAGTNQDHPSIEALRDDIAALGYPVLTFNYAYTERGSKRPDAQPKLLSVHRSVIDHFRSEVTDRIVLMGRSMGGRMGTYLAAEGEQVEGLILHGYPLHPAGKPEKLRKDHLPDITQPMLFIVGERDPLSKMDLYDQWVRPLPSATTYVVADGDHSMKVRKASGRTNEAAHQEILARIGVWLQSL